MKNASFLRELNHKAIKTAVGFRNQWNKREKITDANLNTLYVACDWFTARPHAFKKTVSGRCLWVYTNHPQDFDDYSVVPGLLLRSVQQADLALPSGAVSLKNPQHAFRTYFRTCWLQDDQHENLQRFFAARNSIFRMSPGFKKIVNGNRRYWLESSYFVDHNEPNIDLMINLALPGIVRKTLPIVARTK